MNAKNAYIILLNYNGWKDTVECLESIFKLEYRNFKVIVCDNNSNDGSMSQIRKWANGHIKASINVIGNYTDVSEIIKPIEYSYYSKPIGFRKDKSKLVLIEIGSNNGFAAGCNVGIKYALMQDDLDFIWLLNNDTVVCKDTLSIIKKYMDVHSDVGLAGTCVKYYYSPEVIQGFGSSFNAALGITRFVKKYQDIDRIHHPLGASMILTKCLLNEIGLMCEDYFLYYEEVDLAIRAYKNKINVSCIQDAVIYHKEGASIGSGRKQKNSLLGDKYMVRSRLIITKKYKPFFLPIVYMGLVITIVKRIIHGQYKNAYCVIKTILRFNKKI